MVTLLLLLVLGFLMVCIISSIFAFKLSILLDMSSCVGGDEGDGTDEETTDEETSPDKVEILPSLK